MKKEIDKIMGEFNHSPLTNPELDSVSRIDGDTHAKEKRGCGNLFFSKKDGCYIKCKKGELCPKCEDEGFKKRTEDIIKREEAKCEETGDGYMEHGIELQEPNLDEVGK